MKKLELALIILTVLFTACKQKDSKKNQQTDLSSLKPGTEVFSTKPSEEMENFDISKIAISTKEIGTFPYLSSPDGYEYKYDKTKKFEEKYFFYNDSLVTKVGGNYFFSTVWKKENNKGDYEKNFVLKSYDDAIKSLGGIQIFTGNLPRKINDLLSKEQPFYLEDVVYWQAGSYRQYVLRTPIGNIWFELLTGDSQQEITLSIIQEETFKQSITMLKADEIKDQIDKTGKAVLYINFDTDKSILKSDGITAVEEIAKVLENDKTLALSIEGHTDNIGDANHNKSLSTDRANEVLKTLLRLKINAKRLKAIGYGATKPLVENNTESNKAKNRRVELVKI